MFWSVLGCFRLFWCVLECFGFWVRDTKVRDREAQNEKEKLHHFSLEQLQSVHVFRAIIANCISVSVSVEVRKPCSVQPQLNSVQQKRVGVLPPMPPCLGIGGHMGRSWQGHPRYTSAHTVGRPLVARVADQLF